MKTYKVHITDHHKEIVIAETKDVAKGVAWDRIQVGYNYGWNNKSDFMKNVKAEIM